MVKEKKVTKPAKIVKAAAPKVTAPKVVTPKVVTPKVVAPKVVETNEEYIPNLATKRRRA